jgi:hypothetical protein
MLRNAAAGPDAAEPMEAADPPSPAGPAAAAQREGDDPVAVEAEADDLLRCAEAAESGAAAAAATPHLARVVRLSLAKVLPAPSGT